MCPLSIMFDPQNLLHSNLLSYARHLLYYDMACFLSSMSLLVGMQYSLDGFQGGF